MRTWRCRWTGRFIETAINLTGQLYRLLLTPSIKSVLDVATNSISGTLKKTKKTAKRLVQRWHRPKVRRSRAVRFLSHLLWISGHFQWSKCRRIQSPGVSQPCQSCHRTRPSAAAVTEPLLVEGLGADGWLRDVCGRRTACYEKCKQDARTDG